MSGRLHAPAAVNPGKHPVLIVQEIGWAPWPVWTGAENLAPTGIRSPDRPARSQSLRYSAHTICTKHKWHHFPDGHIFNTEHFANLKLTPVSCYGRVSYVYVHSSTEIDRWLPVADHYSFLQIKLQHCSCQYISTQTAYRTNYEYCIFRGQATPTNIAVLYDSGIKK